MSIAPAAAPSRWIIGAIALMIGAGLVNSVMLTAIRQLSQDLHPFEIAFFRSAFGFCIILPFLLRRGAVSAVRTRRFGLHTLRAMFNAGSMLTFFWSVSVTPLATVTAITFAFPIFATVLAIPLLGEKVGARRWLGLLVGISGTVLILQPGTEGYYGPGLAMALLSSLFWALVVIVTKKLTADDNPFSIVLWSALLLAVFTFIPAMFVWEWPNGTQLLWLIGIGALGNMVHYGFAKAFSMVDATLLMPFDYFKLIWASLLGFLLFGEVPGLQLFVGGTIILASSVYLASRENRAARTATPAQAPPP